MFDIGFWELCIIGVVLLLVLGPERMPEVARQIGYWVGRTRRTVNNLRAEMKRELDAIPTNEISQAAKLADDGLKDIKSEMTELNKGLKEKVGNMTAEVEDVANTRIGDEDKATDTESTVKAAEASDTGEASKDSPDSEPVSGARAS